MYICMCAYNRSSLHCIALYAPMYLYNTRVHMLNVPELIKQLMFNYLLSVISDVWKFIASYVVMQCTGLGPRHTIYPTLLCVCVCLCLCFLPLFICVSVFILPASCTNASAHTFPVIHPIMITVQHYTHCRYRVHPDKVCMCRLFCRRDAPATPASIQY